MRAAAYLAHANSVGQLTEKARNHKECAMHRSSSAPSHRGESDALSEAVAVMAEHAERLSLAMRDVRAQWQPESSGESFRDAPPTPDCEDPQDPPALEDGCTLPFNPNWFDAWKGDGRDPTDDPPVDVINQHLARGLPVPPVQKSIQKSQQEPKGTNEHGGAHEPGSAAPDAVFRASCCEGSPFVRPGTPGSSRPPSAHPPKLPQRRHNSAPRSGLRHCSGSAAPASGNCTPPLPPSRPRSRHSSVEKRPADGTPPRVPAPLSARRQQQGSPAPLSAQQQGVLPLGSFTACALSRSRVKAGSLAWLHEVLQPPTVPRVVAQPGLPELEGADEDDVAFQEISFKRAIGAGAQGSVWHGTFRGESVAIKRCKTENRDVGRMLLRESRILQRLRHERLVAFLGCCNKPPHVLLIMEYCRGGSLYSLLWVKRKQPKYELKARMALHVAEGLAYLHEFSLVHRDLKTGNIVLDEELNCKICDFGLSVALEKTHLTVKGVIGSPRYMAPEQFESASKITEKVDMWQLGCVMLEVFCLTQPFTHIAGVERIATELLIHKRGPHIPAEADPRARVLIQSCLRFQAKQRPEAETLREALSALYTSCLPAGTS